MNPNPGGQHILHPKLRGEWAELHFMQRATELGFRCNKPWGETSPYDVATDHHGLFRRVQVKCTLYQRHHSYVCTICSSHVIYRPDQLDFFAALVIPTDTWYILPIRATHHQPTVVLSPHLKNSKYAPYEEAWHLLMNKASWSGGCLRPPSATESPKPHAQAPSREAAKECSPRRKPWVGYERSNKAPKGRKKRS